MIEAIVHKTGLAVIDYSDGDLDCDFLRKFGVSITINQ